MTLAELHYAFKLGMDRIDKASSEDFNKAEIDWLLNEAQLVFVRRLLNPDSNSPIRVKGYEQTQHTTDALSSLHIKYPLQPSITPTLLDGVYEIPLNSLQFEYMQLLRLTANAEFNSCASSVTLKFTQTDDVSEVLKDPFNAPSTDYIPYNFGRSSANDGSSIYIYPGKYSILKVNPEYIRYPKRVFFGDYTYIDGTIPAQQGLETPEKTHQEIVDIACLLASLNIENPEYIQLRDRKISTYE